VIARAEGVFLWVRLVIDEIIEGLCEGDTLEELRALVFSIPTELEQLYLRAIHRPRRSSKISVSSHRYESYVMFQIASHTIQPIVLYDFIAASMYLTTGDRAIRDIGQLSLDQMRRRLNSRSCGLLEVTRIDSGFLGPVQFIHQTVKEFMGTEVGAAAIREGLSRSLQEDGHALIRRYRPKAIKTVWAGGS
jgi:hypothetical protein